MYIFTPNLPLVLDQPIKINYYAISSLGAGNIGPGPHFISLIKRTRKAQNSHLGLEPPLGFPFPIFSTFHRPRKNSGNEMKLCSWLRLRLWLPGGETFATRFVKRSCTTQI